MSGTTTRDPFRAMRRLTQEMDRLLALGAGSAAGYPAVSVDIGSHGVAITASIPGVAWDDLEISVHGNTVILKGERKRRVEGAKVYHRSERGAGRFSRMLSLPFAVEPRTGGVLSAG